MRLDHVRVRKYRSIDQQAEFDVGDFTVLIGANNQGKSNLLRAAVLAMEIIEGWASLPNFLASSENVHLRSVLRHRAPRVSRHRDRKVGYEWERDYPIFARGRRGAKQATEVRLDFKLTPSEQSEYRRVTGIQTNEDLPVKVELDDKRVSLSIAKRGPGKHRESAGEIARFITEHVELLHVPAVRTGAVAMEVAESILDSRRRRVLRTEEYRDLVAKLHAMDEQAAADVRSMLRTTMSRFLPDLNEVELEIQPAARSVSLMDILIDDGVSTSISTKGDGVQSLVALALTLEWTRSVNDPDRHLIVAVEEPESHLHPGAVHELRQVLDGIAHSQQVIVTSHSQALVNRSKFGQNVIVGDHSARPARSLEDLRNTLGVRMSDALTAANVVVIGEGVQDELTIPVLMVQVYPEVREWIDRGLLMFESAGSGSKVHSRVVAARSLLIEPIAVLDSDTAGWRDVQKLVDEGHLEETDILHLTRVGGAPAEIEDLLLFECYIAELEDELGFTLSSKHRGYLKLDRGMAWTDRLHSILIDSGMPNPDRMVRRAKGRVHDCVRQVALVGDRMISEDAVPLIDRLHAMVLKRLGSAQ